MVDFSIEVFSSFWLHVACRSRRFKKHNVLLMMGVIWRAGNDENTKESDGADNGDGWACCEE